MNFSGLNFALSVQSWRHAICPSLSATFARAHKTHIEQMGKVIHVRCVLARVCVCMCVCSHRFSWRSVASGLRGSIGPPTVGRYVTHHLLILQNCFLINLSLSPPPQSTPQPAPRFITKRNSCTLTLCVWPLYGQVPGFIQIFIFPLCYLESVLSFCAYTPL